MTNAKARCIVICDRAIGVRFLEELQLNKGYSLIAVHSPGTLVQAWCRSRNVPLAQDFSEFEHTVRTTDFDFLFSIINPRVLPEDLILRPKKAALNFHDSLLPRHRGVNATAWALWQGDTEIGYSWHLMTAQVDGGHVVYRESLPVEPTDTSLSAVTRVFTHAAGRFKEFLHTVLEMDFELATAQTLLKRLNKPFQFPTDEKSLHKRGQRPSQEDRILKPKAESSHEVLRKARALRFGPLKGRPFGTLLLEEPTGLKSVDVCSQGRDPTGNSILFPCSDGKTLFLTPLDEAKKTNQIYGPHFQKDSLNA